MKIRLIGAATAGCMALILSIPAHAQPGCVKEVFYKYCLGSSIQPILARQAPISAADRGAATNYVFSDGGERTNVAVVKGRIQSVSRRYQPGTQQTFNQLGGELRAIYGEPVRTGNSAGRITELWDRSGWRVSLVWNNYKDIQLIYRHEGLAAARRDANAGYAGPNPRGF